MEPRVRSLLRKLYLTAFWCCITAGIVGTLVATAITLMAAGCFNEPSAAPSFLTDGEMEKVDRASAEEVRTVLAEILAERCASSLGELAKFSALAWALLLALTAAKIVVYELWFLRLNID